SLVVSGQMTYFVQVADIDMAGVNTYQAPVGSDGATYDQPMNYDGRNHVIKNFAPKNDNFGGTDCYAQSVFGVFSGELKNLGIVDINIGAAGGRCGAIGGYLGQSSAGIEVTKVTNVYVTGKVNGGSSNYSGGLFGTTGTAVELTNCFVNVEMNGAEGGLNGALAGRLNNPTTINNCYVAGSVAGNANLVCAANKGAVTLNGFVLFNSGSEETGFVAGNVTGDVTMANTTATEAAGVELVKSWAAFSATDEVEGLPALNYALSGAGTETDPYQIACAEDLCNAYRYVSGLGGEVWFAQTADIDMDGVTEYHAISGYNGAYATILHYDGRNHLIKNFVPDHRDAGGYDYYCTSIFGVPSGEISNLGVVDAYVATAQGAGILGAYAGHADGSALILENVFVTGDVVGEGGYTGGMFGTNGNIVTMRNCFANVNVSGTKFPAGLIGRASKNVNLERVYVAGTVDGPDAYLVMGTNAAPEYNGWEVAAFNTGATAAIAANIQVMDAEVEVATAETEPALIAKVAGWKGFTDKIYEGYPMLEGFDLGTSAIFDAIVGEVEANAPAVYYNLQ
ncbi:MAG: hypothetical protein K2K94_02515, partial [Muribaculaceae bacterium]|nr:hypothetical protein [Muribaculaceae bacterium]